MLVWGPSAELCPHQPCSVNSPSRWFQNCFLRLNLSIFHGVQQSISCPHLLLSLSSSATDIVLTQIWERVSSSRSVCHRGWHLILFLDFWFFSPDFLETFLQHKITHWKKKKKKTLPQRSIMIMQHDRSPLETGFVHAQSCHCVHWVNQC